MASLEGSHQQREKGVEESESLIRPAPHHRGSRRIVGPLVTIWEGMASSLKQVLPLTHAHTPVGQGPVPDGAVQHREGELEHEMVVEGSTDLRIRTV